MRRLIMAIFLLALIAGCTEKPENIYLVAGDESGGSENVKEVVVNEHGTIIGELEVSFPKKLYGGGKQLSLLR